MDELSNNDVALVLSETDIRIVPLQEAQAEYDRLQGLPELTEEQQRVLAALVVALGTVPDPARLRDEAPAAE